MHNIITVPHLAFSMVLQTTESCVSLGVRVDETKFHVYSLAVRWCQSLVNGSNFKLIGPTCMCIIIIQLTQLACDTKIFIHDRK